MDAVRFNDLRIVLVDESSNMRNLVRSMLYGSGVRTVMEESSLAGAFEKINSGVVDVCVSELKLVGGSGIDLIRAVRLHSAYPETPMILLTAHMTEQLAIAAQSAGVDEVLCKPVSALALTRRIEMTVANPRDFVRRGDYFGPVIRQAGVSAANRGLVRAPVGDLLAA